MFSIGFLYFSRNFFSFAGFLTRSVYYVHHFVSSFLHAASLPPLFLSPPARYCFFFISYVLSSSSSTIPTTLSVSFVLSPSFASDSRTFYESLGLGMRMRVCMCLCLKFYFHFLLFVWSFFSVLSGVIEIRRNTKLIVIYYFIFACPLCVSLPYPHSRVRLFV